MDNQQIQYLNPYSLLIVNYKGELKRLHCPFNVVCIEQIERYSVNTILQVQKISLFPEDRIFYLIEGRAYASTMFEISSI